MVRSDCEHIFVAFHPYVAEVGKQLSVIRLG
jgi:hypothetical protein